MDAQAVRDIFARLEFKTLIPRVAELAGIEQQMAAVTSAAAVADARRRSSRRRPTSRAWLDDADAEVGVTIIDRGRPARAASASRRRMPRPRRRGRPRSPSRSADWLASDAPEGLQRREAAGQGAAPRGRPARRTRLRRDRRRLAAAPELPRQDARRPRRPLPRREAARGRPDPARARDRGRDARAAVVVHAARRPTALRAELPDERRVRAHRHRAADAAHPRRHGARRRLRSRTTKLVGVLGGARRARRRDRAGGLRGDRPRGEPRLARSSCRRCSSTSCSCPRPARPRRATRRMPRCSPTCRRPTRTRSSTCCCSTARRPSCGRSSSRSTPRSPRTAASARRTCRPAARPAGSRAPTRTCRTSRSARRRAAASAPPSRSARATRRC